ncbi:hypothetical protein D3C86_1214400 [compost metagenome]
MLLHQRGDGVIGFLACPVALPFEQHLLPGHGNDTGLHHAVHRIFMRVERSTTGGVRHHVDLIVRDIMESRECEGGVADFRPQAGDDNLLAATGGVLGQRIANILVVPGIHRGTLENVVFREDREQFRKGVTGEAFRFDRGDGRRDVEDLCRLGEADDIVLQGLAIDRLHTESHLRLLVDEDELAVGGGKDFELGHFQFSVQVVIADLRRWKLGRLRRSAARQGQPP